MNEMFVSELSDVDSFISTEIYDKDYSGIW